MPGEVEQLVFWTQVLIGVELDVEGQVRLLTAAQWQQRRQRLEELGGAPVR